MENKAVIVFGATRGIGLQIALKYLESGYYPILIGRSNILSGLGNDYTYLSIDFDSQITIHLALKKLMDTIKRRGFNLLSIHFLSGGSLGLYADDSEGNMDKYLQVFRHNAVIPFWLTAEIERLSYNNVDILEFHFYSSAVGINKQSHPVYAASKAALESNVHSMIRCRKDRTFIFLYRMGLVSVEYKYPYKLSLSNPLEFKKKFMESIPSKHFTSAYEIAEIALNSTLNRSLYNCMIIDISGGQSWT